MLIIIKLGVVIDIGTEDVQLPMKEMIIFCLCIPENTFLKTLLANSKRKK